MRENGKEQCLGDKKRDKKESEVQEGLRVLQMKEVPENPKVSVSPRLQMKVPESLDRSEVLPHFPERNCGAEAHAPGD